MESCAQGQLWKLEGSYTRVVFDPCVLRSLGGSLSRSGGLTCALRCVSPPGRPALFWRDLGMENLAQGQLWA